MMYLLRLKHAGLDVGPDRLAAEGVLEEARSKLEGRWVVHEGVRVRVVLVERLQTVEPSTIDDAGNVQCSVEVDALVSAPFVGEILDVTITFVDEDGFIASAGAFEVRVKSDQWPSSMYNGYVEHVGFQGYNKCTVPISKGRCARVRILRIGVDAIEATMISDTAFPVLKTFHHVH